MHGRILPKIPAGGGARRHWPSEARQRASLVSMAPLAVVLAVLVSASGTAAMSSAETPALKSNSSRIDGAVSTVLIETSEPVAYLTSQPDPLTVLVDLRNVHSAALEGKPVIATLAPRVLPAAPATASVSAALERKAPATQLRSVRVATLDGGYSVTLTGNGPLLAANIEEAKDLPPRVLVDFHGVGSGTAPALTTVKNDDIDRIRVATNSRQPLITRVVIDLARKLPYVVEQIGDDVRVLFKKAVATAAPVAVAEKTPTPVVTEPPAPFLPAVVVPPAPATPPVITAPISRAPLPVPASVQAAAAAQGATNSLQQNQNNLSNQRHFTGDPVTLDFQGADLRAVLRIFVEISNGLNIVIDPSINGTVDVSLRDVPWDQALDIILRANKLGYSVDGNIVRIVPLNVLAQENEERRKLSEAQALAGELRTLTVPVSYAKAVDLVPVVTRSALSSRGDVQVDARTNTLIIRDLADRLTNAADLVRALDRPQPQVEIEARIVQLNRNSARDLGIQWGFGGQVHPTFGTSTGLAFPSSGNLQAVTGGVNGADPTGVSLAMGSINGALNLDVRLRALESDGKGRILSTPRVATQNNVEAEITQGSQIPIQVISNNTVTVTFKDAALTLRVTPQITAANTVIMRIFVEKAAPNYTQTTPQQPIPSIDTQRAQTTVLMDDGETTVIGGIYTRQEDEVNVRTPFLHRVPLLGWLFRTERRLDDSDELLIFITPRIAK